MYIMKQLRLQIITWNVGGSETINNDQFTKLLCLDKANPVDVYVISLQEIETGFLETAKSFVSYDDWAKLFMSTLSPLGFYLVENVRVQGLSLSVFAHLTHLPFVRFVRTHIVRTGLAGNWGNKGGVAISARVYGEKICILNTHLPAHIEYDEARVEQFSDIIEQMDFDNTLPILSHDVIFWSGDLNFRINDFSRKEILDLIEKKAYADLLQGDQLKRHLVHKDIMTDFIEGEITFPPTYKFDFGTDRYDTSEKQRKPAWTDRILYRINPDVKALADLVSNISLDQCDYKRSYKYIKQVQGSYRSHMELKSSDHKPVTSQYKIKIRNDIKQLIEIKVVGPWQSKLEGEVSVVYSNGMVPDSYDYLALYEENISDFRSYKTWVYLPTIGDEYRIKDSIQTCRFPSFEVEKDGRFRVAYYSSRMSCLLGLSEPFEIKI